MVKLYYGKITSIQSPEQFAYYLEKINKQRRSKILRCKNEEDRYRSLLAGLLLKHGLEQEGLCYEEVIFKESPYGKPFIDNPKGIYFSISHSGEYALCAISDSNIGVDIENSRRVLSIRTCGSLDKIAKRSFSATEYAHYKKIRETAELMKKIDVFLQFWTRKESYSKAVGRGLGMDFSKIDVISEKNKENYVSGWLADGYYFSIYQKNIKSEQVVLFEAVEEDFI